VVVVLAGPAAVVLVVDELVVDVESGTELVVVLADPVSVVLVVDELVVDGDAGTELVVVLDDPAAVVLVVDELVVDGDAGTELVVVLDEPATVVLVVDELVVDGDAGTELVVVLDEPAAVVLVVDELVVDGEAGTELVVVLEEPAVVVLVVDEVDVDGEAGTELVVVVDDPASVVLVVDELVVDVEAGTELVVVLDEPAAVVLVVDELVVEVVLVEVLVVVGRSVAGAHWENSDVLPRLSVAVAVRYSVDASTTRESVAVNAACPRMSVETATAARSSPASPCPVESQSPALKISTTKLLLAAPSRVPATAVPPMNRGSSTGKFCRLFAPVSASAGSFGVTPTVPRSMPSPPFPRITLARTTLRVPLPTGSLTPAPALFPIQLATVLPISLRPAPP
jgi:hypothetical protein